MNSIDTSCQSSRSRAGVGRRPAARPAARPARRRARRWPGLVAAVITLAAAGLLFGAGSAAAVEVTTDYPILDVQAGQDVTVGLDLTSSTLERVALRVADTPPDWTADLQGGGFTIGGVYVGPKQTPAVSLHVQVPADASTGTYHLTVDATAPSGTKSLDLQFDVVAQSSHAFALTSEFPKLQGSTTDTFDFSLKIANNTGTKATFGLTAQGPQGWTVTASPASQDKASAVDVDAGSKADVSVTAKPPSTVSAGTYPITVTAQGKGTELQTKLTVQVVGSAEIKLATADQVLNASGSAGDTTDVHLVVSNTGTAPLQGVSLASTPPSGWKVTFDPAKVDSVAPGKSADVVAHITPAGNAITGDYQVTLTANSPASNDHVDIRYTVQTSTWWGLIGVIVIAVAVVALLYLFRRFGRR